VTEDGPASGRQTVSARDRAQYAAAKIALGLLWRGGQRSRLVRRIAGSLEWDSYRAEIDALRTTLRTEYAAAVQRGEFERQEPVPDLDAALMVALQYFHAKEAPPLPLPPGLLESTGDLLKYFVAEATPGRSMPRRS
jgi:hypothetical protein